MPRKPKYSKEEVLTSAFEVTRRSGFETVTAASVAANMGYTGSSLFTHFESMDALRQEVYRMAKTMLIDTLAGALEYTPAFQELGLRWIRFAEREPHLYRMLFAGNPHAGGDDITRELDVIFLPMQKEVQTSFDLTPDEAEELISQCVTQANGIAWFIVNGYGGGYTEEKISRCLSNTCLGMILLLKSGDGRLTPETAERIAAEAAHMPVRR